MVDAPTVAGNMDRGYYDIYRGGDPNSGMDLLQLRQPPGPFHYLINEQAKSLVALQELQNEVGALLEFRDVVIETFPNLRTKLASSPSTMTSHNSNIPVAVRRDWEPGIRVRRKLISKDDVRSVTKRIGDNTIQDSGFSTETSSKETHSASSTAPSASAAMGCPDESEDELINLLEIIDQKGTRLKNEVEALQASLQCRGDCTSDDNFHNALCHATPEDIMQLRKERDMLLDRLAEMEAEVLAGRVHTCRLQEDLENLLTAKHDLEEQLKTVLSQRGEVNSRIRDLHLEFVTKSTNSSESDNKDVISSALKKESVSSQSPIPKKVSDLDVKLGDELYKVNSPDCDKIAAVLKERDPLVLQKHLLNTIVHNQVLQEKLNTAAELQSRLNKTVEENEDLQFQLQDKYIELEGTKAKVRMLEKRQKPTRESSPDIIRTHDSAGEHFTRSEITTASMKAMSPLPLNLQFDHSSSTESAHDQAESTRKSEHVTKRKPSKIPLVKNSTQKTPPTDKHSPIPSSTRSRSGESPGRPHSSQSWRNRSEGNSLSGSRNHSSLAKSRNGSLVSAKDSLTGKLRSSDSLSKLRDSPGNSFSSNRNTLRKSSAPSIRRTGSVRDSPEVKTKSDSAEVKSDSPWILSSCKCNTQQDYIDSLDKAEAERCNSVAEGNHACIWHSEGNTESLYYDSIDTALNSNLYQQNGEDLAEFDSLEKQLSHTSSRC